MISKVWSKLRLSLLGNGLNALGYRVIFKPFLLLKPWFVDRGRGNESELVFFECLFLNMFSYEQQTKTVLVPDWYIDYS